MNLQKSYSVLSITDLCIFILATIFVIVFQFSGEQAFVIFALAIYSVAFLITSIVCVLKIYIIKEQDNLVKTDKEVEINKSASDKHARNAKVWEILKAVLSALFAIFTMIVLILY